jgi:acetolactate synthase-1/2/3 large subunit
LSPRRTVGRVIADGLAAAGVRWAFTVPGESFLGLLDALPEAGISVIATRHEGGASFMAEAIGQLTGAPAAVLGTRAVGAGNMAIGIHTARQNSTPLVALLGQVQRPFLGREAFQEVDLVASFGSLAKWAAQIDAPDAAGQLVARGLGRMLNGRPGPVLFALPEDVLDVGVDRPGIVVDRLPPPNPDASDVRAVVELLSSARRPAILAGAGVIAADARDALVALSERLSVPVFSAWRRPAAFPNDHPNFLGTTGYGSAPGVAERLVAADALLVIGCRLNEIASFEYQVPAPKTRWAHVDLEPREAGHGLSAPDLAIAADARAFLLAAADLLSAEPRADLSSSLSDDRARFEAATTMPARRAGNGAKGEGIDPVEVVRALQSELSDDAIMTTDAGNFALWPARYLRFRAGQVFLGPTSGAMGYGLPAAIAGSLAEPDRQVVALCGDGGFAMTMNEIETAVRTGAHPVVLVFDNERYGTIAMHQQNEHRRRIATDLGPIDFAAVARAMGAQGQRITDNDELLPALRAALDSRRTTVLHLNLDPHWITPDRYDETLTTD